MATVWAARIGNWHSDTSSGWSHNLGFNALSDLLTTLGDEGLRGRVNRLGIVAHGDVGGLVQLDRNLTVSTLSSFSRELNALKDYLTLNAMLIFYACVAGRAEPGTRLLRELSQILEGRTIVGFNVYGCYSPHPSVPGQMRSSLMPSCSTGSTGGPMSPWNEHAKWAYQGWIARWPYDEQIRRDSYRCGYPSCDGHRNPRDRCTGWAPIGLRHHRP
jgi:hypothetical protein